MTVELNLTHLIFLAIAGMSGLWAMAKMFLSQQEKALAARFKTLAEVIGKNQASTYQVERDFLHFKAELPVQYVRREDYIRGQSIIEAKLDSLAMKFENMQLRIITERPHHGN